MTGTTAATVSHRELTEPFRHYRLDWRSVSARTDTPDLIAVFRTAELAAAYRDMAEEDLALAEADMAAGAETLGD